MAGKKSYYLPMIVIQVWDSLVCVCVIYAYVAALAAYDDVVSINLERCKL